jgi:hypothetical protein
MVRKELTQSIVILNLCCRLSSWSKRFSQLQRIFNRYKVICCCKESLNVALLSAFFHLSSFSCRWFLFHAQQHVLRYGISCLPFLHANAFFLGHKGIKFILWKMRLKKVGMMISARLQFRDFSEMVLVLKCPSPVPVVVN